MPDGMADPDAQGALGGSAVTAYVTSHLDEMPIRYPVRVEIVSPEPFHEPEGYSIATSIEKCSSTLASWPMSDSSTWSDTRSGRG
jgi:hypothetical protein